MKITPAQYEEAYRVGLKFYDSQGQLGIQEAKEQLKRTGLNQNTAADFIYDVSHLLNGECYKRALSEPATNDFLSWIRRDRGDAALAKALQALQLHIDYRRNKKQSDTCKGLRKLIAKHMALLPSIKESTLVLTWKDAESDCVMDWFPLSWFAEEGIVKEVHHPVGEDNKKQGRGYCDVTVNGHTAELDYRPYAKANAEEEVLLGIVRLTFADEDRTSIAAVEWMPQGEDVFEGCKFESQQYEVPHAPPYLPPTEAAGKRVQMVRERPGQFKFRRELKGAYENRCCMTGCSVAEALEGAHIDPYLAPESDNLRNGLLLRRDVHALYDKHLIAIDPDTHMIHVASKARGIDDYATLHGIKLKLPADVTHQPDAGALKRRWPQFRGD